MAVFRVLIYFVSMIGLSNAIYKRWLPDTNFDNPANWNEKRVPCGNDIVIIPDESPVVYVQMNTSIQELALPKNGELIFGKNAGLSFTDSSVRPDTADCPGIGGDLEFVATQPKAWLNPSSWCFASTQQGTCDTQTPLLDVEKIPCAFDDVVFPRQHSFYVDLSEKAPTLTVKSMKIAGSSFTSSSFATYLTSNDGKRMFKTTTSQASNSYIDVTRKACDDMRGCACGNDQPGIASKICGHVEKTCGRPRCKKTIQPVGACCRMCGAVFNITRGYGFDFNSFKDLIRDSFLSDPFVMSSVNVTMSITYEGWVQMALSDRTGERSSTLAKMIKKDMDKDLADGGHNYAIDAVALMFSTGNPLSPSPHTGSASSGMGGGAIAGVVIFVIIILIVLVVVVVIFLFHRSGREIPINLPKLPHVHIPSLPRIPVRLHRSSGRGPAQPQTAAHVDPGFANPLYDTSPFDDGNQVVKEMELMTASQEAQPTFDTAGGGFNNPLYGAEQAVKYNDPSVADSKGDGVQPAKAEATPTPTTTPTTSVLIDFKKDAADDSTI